MQQNAPVDHQVFRTQFLDRGRRQLQERQTTALESDIMRECALVKSERECNRSSFQAEFVLDCGTGYINFSVGYLGYGVRISTEPQK